MGYNHSLERKRFEAEWKHLRKKYRAAGMDQSAIDALYEFDCRLFNSDRRFREHTQPLPHHELLDTGGNYTEDMSPLLKKFLTTLSVEMCWQADSSWFEEIDNLRLRKGISQLAGSDKELLTLHFHYGYTVTEIARMHGVSHTTISRKLTRIKNFLRNFI